jgi:hypothetical protein
MVDALNTVANLPDAGMSVSYAADLMRNVDSLGQQNALGYSPGGIRALVCRRSKMGERECRSDAQRPL